MTENSWFIIDQQFSAILSGKRLIILLRQPVFSNYRISISLTVSGNVIEVLLWGKDFLLIDIAAFPCSFGGSANAFLFIGRFH